MDNVDRMESWGSMPYVAGACCRGGDRKAAVLSLSKRNASRSPHGRVRAQTWTDRCAKIACRVRCDGVGVGVWALTSLACGYRLDCTSSSKAVYRNNNICTQYLHTIFLTRHIILFIILDTHDARNRIAKYAREGPKLLALRLDVFSDYQYTLVSLRAWCIQVGTV